MLSYFVLGIFLLFRVTPVWYGYYRQDAFLCDSGVSLKG